MTPPRLPDPVHRPNPRYDDPVDLSRFAWLSIGAALATMTIKGTAAWLTGSVSLLSDAAESLINLVAAIIALIALKISIKPPDRRHQFGHSKAEYFSAAVEGIMIFVAAAYIIYIAVERLIAPVMPERLEIGLLISIGASIINGVVAFVLLRKGRASGSITLVADGRHLLTDVITSAAVLIGVLLVVITDQPRLDPIVALLAGANILWTGFGLIRDSVNGLMDGSIPEDELIVVKEVLDSYRSPDVEFHAVRSRVAGNRHFMDMHVLVPGAWSVKKGHDLTEEVIDDLVARLPDLRVQAHLEPKEDPKSYDDIGI